MGYVEQFAGLIAKQSVLFLNNDDLELVTEYLLNALLALIRDSDIAKSLCSKSELDLKQILESIIDHGTDKEEYKVSTI